MPTIPPPPITPSSLGSPDDVPGDATKGGRWKTLIAIGAVVILVLGSVFVVTRGGGGSGRVDKLTIAVDTRGDGSSIYLTSKKDGVIQIQGQIVSGNLADVYVHNTVASEFNSLESVIALDKNTLMYWKWEDDDYDRAQLYKFDVKTSATTSIYSGTDVEMIRFIVDSKTWYFNDNGSCMTLAEDGVASRVGPGRCWLASGKLFLTEYDGDMSVVEVDDKGMLKPEYSIPLGRDSTRSSDDGLVVYGTDSESGVAVYSLVGGQRLWSKGSDEVRVQILSMSSDGRTFLAAVDDTSERDSKSDLVLVKFVDGVASESTLVSDYEVGGAIAPDGSGAVVYTRSQGSEDGEIVLYDSKFVSPKPVSSGVGIPTVYRTSAGGLVLVSNKQVHVGTFQDGVSERYTKDIGYSSAFVSPDETVILLSVSEPGESSKEDLLLLRPEFVGEKATAEVVQSGQTMFDLSPTSFGKGNSIVFATRDDGYTTIYQRGLEAGSELARIGEGRLSGYEVASADTVRFFEPIGSDGKDGTRTYGVSGTDASKRETQSESYRLVDILIGPRPATGTTMSDTFSSATSFVDSDYQRCADSSLPILAVGDSRTFDIAQNSSGSMLWTDFCVGPGDGSSIWFSTTVEYTNPMGSSYYSSGRLWVRLKCDDSESSGTSFDEDNSAYTGYSGPGTSLSFTGYVFCRIGDYKDHSYRSYYSDYAQGGQVSVRIDPPIQD